MDLVSLSRRRRAAGTAAPAGWVTEPEAHEPPTPEQLAQLHNAWAKHAKAAKSSGLTGLHSFTRNGKRWEEDPDAVRGFGATIRDFRAENTNA